MVERVNHVLFHWQSVLSTVKSIDQLKWKGRAGKSLIFSLYSKSLEKGHIRSWNLASDRSFWWPSESLFAIYSCMCFWCPVSNRLAHGQIAVVSPVILFHYALSAVFFAWLVERNINTFFGLPVWVNWGWLCCGRGAWHHEAIRVTTNAFSSLMLLFLKINVVDK